MGYAIKKAGVAFKTKLGTNADLSGQADNFSAYFIKDADGTKTDITNAFAEDANTAGLYMVETTIPDAGDYTMVIKNDTIGMGNHEAPIVVVNATIDDVKGVVDDLTTTLGQVKSDVEGLEAGKLDEIEETLKNIQLLAQDKTDVKIIIPGDETSIVSKDSTITGDTSGATGLVTDVKYDSDADQTVAVLHEVSGTFQTGETVNAGGDSTTGEISEADINTVNSIIEFVQSINDAIGDGSSGLAALKGYTDDIENMLLGTQYLADGTTSNPFYDATNPGVAKESSLTAALTTLQGNISDAQTAVETAVSDARDAVIAKTDAIKSVVDANEATLEDAGYGLSALKDLVDDVASDVATSETNITDILNDSTNGLSAIKTELVSRFDNVDAKLVTIEDKVDDNINKQEFRVFA